MSKTARGRPAGHARTVWPSPYAKGGRAFAGELSTFIACQPLLTLRVRLFLPAFRPAAGGRMSKKLTRRRVILPLPHAGVWEAEGMIGRTERAARALPVLTRESWGRRVPIFDDKAPTPRQ
jgi:hypothetical protein